MAENKKPVNTYRAGNISMAVWENVSKDGNPYFSYTIQKSFTRDEGKTWETTNSLSREDLPKLKLVLGQAYADAYASQH